MEMLIEPHALARMQRRGVTHSQIQFVLYKYNMSFTTGMSSSQLRAKLPDGRILKVWVGGSIPLQEPVIIKTVAWLEGVDE